ncbi:MAG: hypothetical protein QXJ31_05100 [Candidatus Bathyarchaeia archaeon]
MRVLLVQVDGFFPNLALMKLSSHHKSLGDEVHFLRLPRKWFRGFKKPVNLQINPLTCEVDKVYISCLFSWNRSLAYSLASMFQSFGCEVELGGTGISLTKNLPENIEKCFPDYTLYPNLNYSLGYFSRGCIRSCPWCVIPKKEGHIRAVADLKDFWLPRHRRIIVLDNNLLAAPNWEKALNDLIKERLEVCFTQGLDIRLINDENAKLLRLCKYRDNEFEKPRLYFSWDILEIEDSVMKGIETLKRHGIPPNRLMFYVLIGYGVKAEDYTWEYFMQNDYYRFEVLKKLKCLPFIMLYNNRKDLPLARAFRRYVNRHLYNSWNFEKYLKHRWKIKYDEEKDNEFNRQAY